jgi:hypothetical protein
LKCDQKLCAIRAFPVLIVNCCCHQAVGVAVGEGVKPTEKMNESEVLLTEQYQTAQQSLINATCDADMARAAKDAFMQRKDMLIQLGSSRRQEIEQTGMSIREHA